MDSIDQSGDDYAYDQSLNKIVKRKGTISAAGEVHIESSIDERKRVGF